MGAGEELRGGKGSTNQDILQETKNKGKIIKSKTAVRKDIFNIQEDREKGQRLKEQALLCPTVPPSDCSW